MNRFLYGTIWIVVYLTIVLAPLLLLLFDPERPGREWWREFSVVLGFVGLSMMGLQFLLTARFHPVVRPFGIDLVYHFHRQISFVALGLVLAHPIILILFTPGLLPLLNPLTAPTRVLLGELSVLFLLVLVVISVKRLNLKISYEPWRITHGFLATGVIVLAMSHIILAGYYIDTLAKQVLWIILGLFWVGTLLYIRVIKPLLIWRKPYSITEVRSERGDTYSLAFQPEGHKGMRFRPGQFAWLTVWSSPFTFNEHPFSFSSSAMNPGQVELSVKDLGDFTARVKAFKPGTRAYLDGPYGVFSIDYFPAPGYVFLAGGIGITPIMSMLRTLADRRDMRPVILFYGSKTWEEMTFREEIEQLKERLDMRVIFVPEEPEPDWQGESGFITSDMLSRYLPKNRLEFKYFICGPEPMMNAVESALDSLGIEPDHVITERFNLV